MSASMRDSMELFKEVGRLEHELQLDFKRHDERQKQFAKKFEQEARRHRQTISTLSCLINSTPGSSSVLYNPNESDNADDIDEHLVDEELFPTEKSLARQLHKLNDPATQQRREALKHLYVPSVVTTDIICDVCGAFRRAALVKPLPLPWQEFMCEETKKHYFYNPETHIVLWKPPPSTNPLSVVVFDRTNSISTLCHCIPSHERRKKCLHALQTYALDTSHREIEKRNRALHGAFKTLAHSLCSSK